MWAVQPVPRDSWTTTVEGAFGFVSVFWLVMQSIFHVDILPSIFIFSNLARSEAVFVHSLYMNLFLS